MIWSNADFQMLLNMAQQVGQPAAHHCGAYQEPSSVTSPNHWRLNAG